MIPNSLALAARALIFYRNSSLSVCHFLKQSCCPLDKQQQRFRSSISESDQAKQSTLTLQEYLVQKIKINGPMTIAQYMKEVLTHPTLGYYMKKDVFGVKGDFITSPEISQMFGELLAVWVAVEYQLLYDNSSNMRIVELGPGRGTLAADMLRTLNHIPHTKGKVSLGLIDISPKMRELQYDTLIAENKTESDTDLAMSKWGQPVCWYDTLDDVPSDQPVCFIAHEYFDALPIHKFQKIKGSWREVLVGLPQADTSELQYMITAGENANSRVLVAKDETREHVEINTDSGITVQKIADKIIECGGFALIADYGHDGDKTDTFRAFKDHKLHNPLEAPGEADLTADVDFSFMKRCLQNHSVNCFGSITQQRFLHNMGISHRLKKLLSQPNRTSQQVETLNSAHDMLCDPQQMGERFKFFTIFDKKKTDLPAGFAELS